MQIIFVAHHPEIGARSGAGKIHGDRPTQAQVWPGILPTQESRHKSTLACALGSSWITWLTTPNCWCVPLPFPCCCFPNNTRASINQTTNITNPRTHWHHMTPRSALLPRLSRLLPTAFISPCFSCGASEPRCSQRRTFSFVTEWAFQLHPLQITLHTLYCSFWPPLSPTCHRNILPPSFQHVSAALTPRSPRLALR